MTYNEFAAWLVARANAGELSTAQVDDLLAQRALFDQNRRMIETEFRNHAAGYVAEQRRVADSAGLLLRLAGREFPDRMLYFETIEYSLSATP